MTDVKCHNLKSKRLTHLRLTCSANNTKNHGRNKSYTFLTVKESADLNF